MDRAELIKKAEEFNAKNPGEGCYIMPLHLFAKLIEYGMVKDYEGWWYVSIPIYAA